jgi:hypothetical protein
MKNRNRWGTLEEAFEDQRWMFHSMAAMKKKK